ncbi:GNAT family N-acetyltransferase [Chitinophagaceae bacterium LB-8]|uniref:GNAT family N-acetyltransferase n=1 Tax=Paraflavisolibacter caeni TaxID=2982496 RepID=A0A9X2XRS0_9BACT|nr:GNAT family N-acetyltransferase [Paraflavisolibacter caeni]MCU7547609.1 GNAT family N-acetyltransferase [Paraflavisolibacter caeni]
MQAIELRKCNLEDISILRQVALQSYQEHYMYLWTDDQYAWWYMDRSFGEQSLLQQMNDPDSTFYFVLNHDEIVGFLKINRNRSFNETSAGECIELERLYLLKKVTNKGIGRVAVQMIIDKAKEDHVKTVWLKSMDTSKAVQFYEKIGFHITKTEILPFEGFKDEYRDIHVMRLDLTAH